MEKKCFWFGSNSLFINVIIEGIEPILFREREKKKKKEVKINNP